MEVRGQLLTTWIKLGLGSKYSCLLSHLAGLSVSFLTLPHTTLYTAASVNTSSSLNSPGSFLPLGFCTESFFYKFLPLSFHLTDSAGCHLKATSSGKLDCRGLFWGAFLCAEDCSGEPSWGLSGCTCTPHCLRSI